MSDDGRQDERLARLLASVRADADPVLWTRVRARIEARERAPRWQAWLMRPAALGTAFAVFAVAMATSVALVATAPRTITAGIPDDLTDALVAELSETSVTPSAPVAPGDSGATR